MVLRGTGFSASSGMVEWELEAAEWERRGWGGMTGSFWEAEVEGLRSWVGEGCRFREADWRVEARVRAGEEAEADIVSGAFLLLVELWMGVVR